MGYHDVQFPSGVSYGTRGGPSASTAIVETDSGAEQRVARWNGERNRYDAAYGIKKRSDAYDVLAYYRARQGAANSFPLKDWMDYASTADGGVPNWGALATTNVDQNLGVGDATRKDFQLVKKYTSGAQTRTRVITKPVAGTVKVALDGVDQASGWTVNTTTGVVTFTAAPGVGVVVTAGYEFNVEVRFGADIDVNGLQARIDGFDGASIDQIPLVEVMDGALIDDEFYYGGAPPDAIAVTASFTVNLSLGRAQLWNVTVAALSATMPNEAALPDGDHYLTVKNTGTQSIQVKRSDGTNEFSIAAGAGAVFILVTQAGVRRWYGVGG